MKVLATILATVGTLLATVGTSACMWVIADEPSSPKSLIK